MKLTEIEALNRTMTGINVLPEFVCKETIESIAVMTEGDEKFFPVDELKIVIEMGEYYELKSERRIIKSKKSVIIIKDSFYSSEYGLVTDENLAAKLMKNTRRFKLRS